MPPIKKGRPYIGITGFRTPDQVEQLFKVFKALKPLQSDRLFHVGVMTSRKMLRGLQTEFADAFPAVAEIAPIFRSDLTYNCLHYTDRGFDPDLCRNLCDAMQAGGMGLDALQLDLTWPNPGDVANALHISRKIPDVILQVGNAAFERIADNPDLLVERLFEYKTFIHRVLLDKSMGKGKTMDPEFLKPFLRAIRKAYPHLLLVVAGGLGTDTAYLIEQFVEEFPEISFDVEAGVRKSRSNMDPIDLNLCSRYLAEHSKF